MSEDWLYSCRNLQSSGSLKAQVPLKPFLEMCLPWVFVCAFIHVSNFPSCFKCTSFTESLTPGFQKPWKFSCIPLSIISCSQAPCVYRPPTPLYCHCFHCSSQCFKAGETKINPFDSPQTRQNIANNFHSFSSDLIKEMGIGHHTANSIMLCW